MANISRSYLSKIFVQQKKSNDDVITITTQYFSPEGDIYELDQSLISPSLVQTTQSLNELEPEISNEYPYKIVTPIDIDGATIILSPSINTFPTASQNYYVPIYFERYKPEILRAINKNFLELTVPEPVTSSNSPGEG